MKINAKIPIYYPGADVPDELSTGDVAPDGSIYLGVHGDCDWFVAAQDARYDGGQNMILNFNEAAAHAKRSRAHMKDDWIMPPGKNHPKKPDILRAMYEAQNTGAFDGTFPLEGTHPVGWYWSSTPDPSNASNAWYLRMKDGKDHWGHTSSSAYVRCVRSVPRKP